MKCSLRTNWLAVLLLNLTKKLLEKSESRDQLYEVLFLRRDIMNKKLQLLESLKKYEFSCDAGWLENCAEYQELHQLLKEDL